MYTEICLFSRGLNNWKFIFDVFTTAPFLVNADSMPIISCGCRFWETSKLVLQFRFAWPSQRQSQRLLDQGYGPVWLLGRSSANSKLCNSKEGLRHWGGSAQEEAPRPGNKKAPRLGKFVLVLLIGMPRKHLQYDPLLVLFDQTAPCKNEESPAANGCGWLP